MSAPSIAATSRTGRPSAAPDKAVSLYGRQSNSGTYVFMQEHRPRQQELLDRHEGNERQRPDHRGHPPGRGRRSATSASATSTTRTASDPQRPQGPQNLQGAERHRPIRPRTKPPSTAAVTPYLATPLHGHQRQAEGRHRRLPELGDRAPKARPSSSARASSRSARAGTRPRTKRTSNDVDRSQGLSHRYRAGERGLGRGYEKKDVDEPQGIGDQGLLLDLRHPGRPGPHRHLPDSPLYGRPGVPRDPHLRVPPEEHIGIPPPRRRPSTASCP